VLITPAGIQICYRITDRPCLPCNRVQGREARDAAKGYAGRAEDYVADKAHDVREGARQAGSYVGDKIQVCGVVSCLVQKVRFRWPAALKAQAWSAGS
jgi:hypothetical protein